jgi:hypothetical protein
VAALVRHLKHTFDVANHSPKHVCAADNADQHAVAQDEHALDPVLHHEVTQIRERGVLMEMTGARMMSRTRHWVATDRSAPLELQRQVQIAAGSIVLVTTVLGLALSPWFFAPTAFVGAVPDHCRRDRLLRHGPRSYARHGTVQPTQHERELPESGIGNLVATDQDRKPATSCVRSQSRAPADAIESGL